MAVSVQQASENVSQGEEGYCPAIRNVGLYRVKTKLAQEGHGGITPTDPLLIPEEVFKLVQKVKGALPSPVTLTPQQKKLYDLIWRRALASQMTDAVLKKVKVMHLDGRVFHHNNHACAKRMISNRVSVDVSFLH